jgi:predicted O-linked N-acetylglucosamine transferase (SPINDLY family)
VAGAGRAIDDLEEALRGDPRNVELLKGLGNAHKAAGNVDAAIAAYRRAFEADPRFGPVLFNLGSTLREAGRRGEAAHFFRLAFEADPRDHESLVHYATLLHELGDFGAAEPRLREALRAAPENALLWWYLGVALARRGLRLQEARACLEKAIALDGEMHEARFHLGHVHSVLGEREEAQRCYAACHDAEPANLAFANALLFESQQVCDWSRFEELGALRRKLALEGAGAPIAPFGLLSVPSTRSEQLRWARDFAASIGAARDIPPAAPPPSGKLRIGYLSGDFHDHATAHLAAELFELHDRDSFEVLGFSFGPDDASGMRSRLRAAFDRFVDVEEMSDADAASAIRDAGVHILVDLKGYTLEARTEIVARRPAPVQVSFLGYPGTMGAPFIDYLVCDRFIVPPSHAADYSERLAILADTYQPNDRKRAHPVPLSRRQAGLPADAFVFCCFHQPYKILPDVFAQWMGLLRDVPRALLWLLDWNPAATRNLRARAEAAGIDPGRLVFAPKLPLAEHLARLPAADLLLDTFPYGAHTTASDALWMGLPVLTRAGETFASRVAGSLLRAAGLPDLVASSAEEYRRLAKRLATDRATLDAIRSRAAEARFGSALFDTPRFARNLETAYRRMWAIHASGRAPMDIGPDA